MEQRTVGIGRSTRKSPATWCNVGLMVRASGQHAIPAPITRLLLRPAANEVHSEQGCDVISSESAHQRHIMLNMIDHGLDNLPGGPLMVEGFITFRTVSRWLYGKRRAKTISTGA